MYMYIDIITVFCIRNVEMVVGSLKKVVNVENRN